MGRLVISTALLCGLLLMLLCGCNSTQTKTDKSEVTAKTRNPPTTRTQSTRTTVQPLSQNDIDQYLARKPSASHPSPLVGLGATFEKFGNQYAIDSRLIVAITAAETTYATGVCHSTPVVTTRNAWNWFWCYGNDSCGDNVCVNSTFDTWGSGIQTLSKYMRKNYINKGYNTVELIASKYCTAGCENWVPNVTASMKQMNGDPNNLTLGGQ